MEPLTLILTLFLLLMDIKMVFQTTIFSKALLQEGFKEKGRGQLKQFRDHEIDRIQYFMKTLISNAS